MDIVHPRVAGIDVHKKVIGSRSGCRVPCPASGR
jgi:hypothetical protein